MIDGIKIECNYLEPQRWRNHPDLHYFPRIDEETGEILRQTVTAAYQGLKFRITESRETPGLTYYTAFGSLHRFANHGGPNADDFTYNRLLATVQRLAKEFHIEPENSILRQLEFGVNIEVQETAKDWIKGCISMPGNKFAQMDAQEPFLGLICEREDYNLKIYDKGKQAGLHATNLVRIELKVRKMRWIQKTGIKVLADLLDKVKLKLLGAILGAQFNKVIYYSGGIDPGNLTVSQQLSFEKFTNPRRWLSAGKSERYKMIKAWEKFQIRHGDNGAKACALLQVQNKWVELVGSPQESGDFFTGFGTHIAAPQVATFSPLEYGVKKSPGTTSVKPNTTTIGGGVNTQTKNVENPRTLKRCCVECGRDISQQHPRSKFCSVKLYGPKARRCRDKSARRARTTRERLAREQERETLATAVVGHPLGSFQVAFPPEQISLIDWRKLPAPIPYPLPRITIQLPAGVPEKLTGPRARQLIQFINERLASPSPVATLEN